MLNVEYWKLKPPTLRGREKHAAKFEKPEVSNESLVALSSFISKLLSRGYKNI